MPELPDVEVYVDALERYTLNEPLAKLRIASPFLLRSVEPPLSAFEGQPVRSVARLGKRIVLGFDDDLFLVLHLMIAGRLRWKPPGAKLSRKVGLAALDFPKGSIVFTEASPKKRASLYAVRGRAALSEHDPGGIEPLTCSLKQFSTALKHENHTLKRATTDPRVLSGIGNAYSDEILHRAQLSPIKWTSRLTDAELKRLFTATRDVLTEWTARLKTKLGDGFPDKVSAFQPEMAVHGKFNQPCPVCASTVQRIRRADNEVNYCPTCQTNGKLLADRGLSRLLKGDWPKTLEELEELKRR